MSLTFNLSNALGALGIIGALLMVARAVGKWEAKLQANLDKLTETQKTHDTRIATVEKEVGELMNQRNEAREDMLAIVREATHPQTKGARG